MDTLHKTTTSASQLLSNQAEYLDHEKRKKCAILHGISESGDEPLQNKLAEYLSNISFPSNQIIQAYRLGRPAEKKDRPVKLILTNEIQKWDLVKRINETKTNKTFATLDLSQEEREKDYQARQKLKELKSNNPGEVYKIKNFKILKRQGEKWT